jgi:nucleolar protein 53
VRRSLPRFSRTALKSHQIIAQRSAVPAIHARPRRSLLSPREKERLLRIARKNRRGPLNSIVDPSQPGAGSALLEVSEAVKKSGQYDMWSAQQIEAASGVGVKVKVCARGSPNKIKSKRTVGSCVGSPHVGTRRPSPAHRDHTACRPCSACRNVV